MDRITIANLQAELGILEPHLLKIAPRRDHGPAPVTFEDPPELTTSLSPPSKTKSLFPFGIDGTLAWTTPAGELLQVASCLDSKLISVEYKRSIDRGRGHLDCGKMLERALDQPQGFGFGIGLSLLGGLEPLGTCWLHNRWPRYHFTYEGLDILLQYYINGNSVIQQYFVRNTSVEEKCLPYTFSSDLVLRGNGDFESPIHAVPTKKTPERLFLFRNSEVLIQNQTEKCQVVMALFQNGQKRTLWGENLERSHENGDSISLSLTNSGAEYEMELQEIEASLRNAILDGQLEDDTAYAKSVQSLDLKAISGMANSGRSRSQDHDYNDYSCSGIDLVVPGGSTQELQAVIQIRKLPQPWVESLTRDRKDSHTSSDLKTAGKDPKSDSQGVRTKQTIVTATEQLFPAVPLTLKGLRIRRPMDEYLNCSKACEADYLLGSARFYMLKACLIAELTPGADPLQVRYMQFTYAEFLLRHGWTSAALQTMERLFHDLSTNAFKNRHMSILKEKIRMRLAAPYVELGRFSAAEDMYIKAFGDQRGDRTNANLTPSAAHCLERGAWTQIC